MPAPTLTDQGLLEAARRGDRLACEQLVDRHLESVRAVCRGRLGSSHDVADAVQDTFVRALVSLDQVTDADAVGAWLRAIAVRVCADHGRRVSRTICLPDPAGEAPCAEPAPLEAVVTAEEQAGLRERLLGLAERDRRALWLRDALELPVADVAADLGLTEGSTRVLLTRARKRLRAAYQGVVPLGVGAWFRLRQRLASFADRVPVDVPAALAAQLALVVTVAVVGSPGADAPGAPPLAGSSSLDAAAPLAATAGPPAADTAADADPAPGTRPATPPGHGDAPVVDIGEEPPTEPEALEISTSDEDGELVELLVFLGDTFGGDAEDEEGDEEGDEDDGDDEDADTIELFPRSGEDRGADGLAD